MLIWSVPANPSALPVEVTLLCGVGRVPSSHSVGIGGRGGVGGHFEQVTADRVEPVVTGECAGKLVGRGQATEGALVGAHLATPPAGGRTARSGVIAGAGGPSEDYDVLPW